MGYAVVDPPSVVSTHLTETIRNHAFELLGRQETKQLVDHLSESYPILVEEITPSPLSIGEIQKVLSKLLKERVSIRNLPVIFETLADYGKVTTDTDLLTEYVRQALARQITSQYAVEGVLKVVTLSGANEKAIADAIEQTEHGTYLSLSPDASQQMINSVGHELEQASIQGISPVLLCSPAVRMYLKQLIERFFPMIAVLSYNELDSNIEVQSIGVVK